MKPCNPMSLLFRKILSAGLIALFPLMMVALMTYRFQGPIPLLYDWWLGAMFIWSAFFYGMICPLFYQKYPFVFKCFVWVGFLSLLTGVTAWWYYYSYSNSGEMLFCTVFDRGFIRVIEFLSVDSWCWKKY